jgi:hypothetical protein
LLSWEGFDLSGYAGNAPERYLVIQVKLELLYDLCSDGDDDGLCQKYALSHY